LSANLGRGKAGGKMPRAQHILGYAQSLRGGGVERALLRLAGGWVAAGRRVTLVIGRAEGPLAAELPAGVQIVELGSASYPALARALPGVVRRVRPDVLFCAGSHYTGVAAWTRARLGRGCPPIVGKVSNAVARGDHGAVVAWAHDRWLRAHPRFLDAVVAMTPASAAAVAAVMGLDKHDVAVIPNPPAVPISGAALPGLPERFVLGVGRLVAQKRWDRAVAALPRLADRDVPLVLLGEGPERAALAGQAAILGVGGRLLMPGYAPNPLAAMARAEVVVLTSDFEGVPGVLREALSVGTPVVATDSSPAVREIVNAPELGTVVARDDADGLVAALERWLAADAVRPAPVVPPGADAAARYLELFDGLEGSREQGAGSRR
jgi:glycosyltransferase involved in cell wall biosynthesis